MAFDCVSLIPSWIQHHSTAVQEALLLLLAAPHNSMAEAAPAAAEASAADKYRGHKRPHELIPSHIRDKEKIDVSLAGTPPRARFPAPLHSCAHMLGFSLKLNTTN